jgi:hypothetical protein
MAEPSRSVPTDLHAFGNSKRPRSPRIKGYNLKPGHKADITLDAAGHVGPGSSGGASVFGDPFQARLEGHYHVLPAGTELPDGLAVVADGADVGGLHAPTHHTLTPTRDMTPEEFQRLYDGLPWRYGGTTE